MMENNDLQEKEISVFEILLMLKEKWIVITTVTIIGALIGWLLFAFFVTPQYEASVNMIVNTKTDITSTVTTDNINSAQNLVDTYAIIIKSNTVLNEVINSLELDVSYEEIYECVSVNAINNTQVMKIAVRDDDPLKAKQIVEAIVLIAPNIVVEAVEAGSCKVVSQVLVGKDPVSPNVMRNTMIAAFVSLCICVAIIILKELIYDYIVDDVDIGRKLGMPVLGIIPDREMK